MSHRASILAALLLALVTPAGTGSPCGQVRRIDGRFQVMFFGTAVASSGANTDGHPLLAVGSSWSGGPPPPVGASDSVSLYTGPRYRRETGRFILFYAAGSVAVGYFILMKLADIDL